MKLQKKEKPCRECDLNIYSEPTCIPGGYWGNKKKCEVMIINSYANDEDEANNQATPQGQVLDKVINYLGLTDFYYTNAVKCRTPARHKIKKTESKKCGKLHLHKEIEKVKPKYILLIGSQAVEATIGGTITSRQAIVTEVDDIKYMATMSPGIIFRDPGKERFINLALNAFKNLINGVEATNPDTNIIIVDTLQKAKKSIKDINKNIKDGISFDIETTGLNRFKDEINLFGYGNDRVQYIVPLQLKFSPLRNQKIAQYKIITYLMKKLNKLKIDRVAGNGKFDNLFLKLHFGNLIYLDFDVVNASHMLNENTPNGVNENAIVECGAQDWDIPLSKKTGKIKSKREYNELIEYLGYDIIYEYKLYKVFKTRLEKDKSLSNLFYYLTMPALRSYEDTETRGVPINEKQFRKVEKKLTKQLKRVTKALNKYTKGKDTNWASSKQVGEFLYTELNLPVIERTEAGAPATGESVLKQLRDKHPAVELLLEHRGIAIQISHFVDGWKERMVNGKLYPSFKMLTVTGRTSCKDPNLQQVPRDPLIRSLIAAPKGRVIIEMDFSQAELRIAAMMSGDTAMKRIYLTGGDIHTNTYEMVSGNTLSDDMHQAKEERKTAKAVNFGFVYGMGYNKFQDYARDSYGVHLTLNEAKKYRENFFRAYNALPEWHTRQKRIARSAGQVRSLIGRLRRLPDVYSSDKGKVAEAERQAINSPVQGLGSDCTILGMNEVNGYSKKATYKLDKSKFDTLGSIHDAVLFSVDKDYTIEFIEKAHYMMEHPVALTEIFKFKPVIPMVVDVTVGPAWGEGIELDFSNKNWKKEVDKLINQ